ncbi:hypothetical protein CLV40_108241 [Actinokineospora auranticolor]|uniref:Uncharacterized protein n=1 Tax=Actinokineospora auranticolor TaxID=155976 RepID=A0A2S6GPR2_9PSEU|nr:hypothetical protein CLV40_108241 [Actinokineospora auranticolor]
MEDDRTTTPIGRRRVRAFGGGTAVRGDDDRERRGDHDAGSRSGPREHHVIDGRHVKTARTDPDDANHNHNHDNNNDPPEPHHATAAHDNATHDHNTAAHAVDTERNTRAHKQYCGGRLDGTPLRRGNHHDHPDRRNPG